MRDLRKRYLGRLAVLISAVACALMCWGFFPGVSWAGNGFINVVTDPPGAAVTVDTEQEGVTPCKLEVPEGTRRVKIKLRAFIGANQNVDVKGGETVDVNLKLVPIPTT
jgi:hypothetical protein